MEGKMQLEIIDLEYNSVLKASCHSNCKRCDIILAPASWKWIKNLRSVAHHYVYHFGRIYRCGQLFYAMKLIQQLDW